MTAHSPAPWSFSVEGDEERIRDATGHWVHIDTAYYPSGLKTADAQYIVWCVNRVAELEALLSEADRLVIWETVMPNGNEFQQRVEQALGRPQKVGHAPSSPNA